MPQVIKLVSPGKNGPLPRQLYLSDFGRISKGRFAVANPPHNAPMFRRRLMDTVGYFDDSLDPLRRVACAWLSVCALLTRLPLCFLYQRLGAVGACFCALLTWHAAC